MGVFEFLTISIVAISVGSVVKAWIKHRGSTQQLAAIEQKLLLLEAARVDERLQVVEEIVTGTESEDTVERQMRQLERAEAYKRLTA